MKKCRKAAVMLAAVLIMGNAAAITASAADLNAGFDTGREISANRSIQYGTGGILNEAAAGTAVRPTADGFDAFFGTQSNPSPAPDDADGFNPCWPVPDSTYILQFYGNDGHEGLDIAGLYGTPIVAAESGEVIMANSSDFWADGWGYYVLIYHNGTYTTRYAHLSALTVSNGQYVSKGTVIGYEGSTGDSTGPHLHFGIYENGACVNPLQFIEEGMEEAGQ